MWGRGGARPRPSACEAPLALGPFPCGVWGEWGGEGGQTGGGGRTCGSWVGGVRGGGRRTEPGCCRWLRPPGAPRAPARLRARRLARPFEFGAVGRGGASASTRGAHWLAEGGAGQRPGGGRGRGRVRPFGAAGRGALTLLGLRVLMDVDSNKG